MHDLTIRLCAERLDGAIETALSHGVSTKYAKKVRRRLLSSLDGPQPAETDPQRTREHAAAVDPPAPSTPPAAANGGSGAVFGSANPGVRHDNGNAAKVRRDASHAVVPRDALLPAELQPRANAAAPGASHGALLAALLPRAKPKPPLVPDAWSVESGPANAAMNGVHRELRSDQMVRHRPQFGPLPCTSPTLTQPSSCLACARSGRNWLAV